MRKTRCFPKNHPAVVATSTLAVVVTNKQTVYHIIFLAGFHLCFYQNDMTCYIIMIMGKHVSSQFHMSRN